MNAKRKSTVLVVVSVLLGPGSLGNWSTALHADEPTGPNSYSTAREEQRLTRGDVDELLRQARAAIQHGNLDQADALLTRAENSGIHYPLLHFGSTPTSVRREFVQAARKSGWLNRPTSPGGAMDVNPLVRSAVAPAPRDTEAGDSANPFVGRSLPLPPAGASAMLPPAGRDNMPLPAGPASQPLPPVTATGGYDTLDAVAATEPQSLPAVGQTLNNPFAEAADRTAADARVVLPDENPEWKLPEAPLPPRLRTNESANEASYGLAPPQRAQSRYVNPSAPESRPVGPIHKQQVLARLRAGRQALAAGDLEQAEKLAREAEAAGVADSEFLPGEDRPALLAWDIVRARQQMRGAGGATSDLRDTSIPPADERYAVRQAAGTEPAPPIDSNERWTMLPEPLSLPSDSTVQNAGAPVPLSQSAAPLAQGASQLPAYSPPESGHEALDMLEAGVAAMRMHDRKSALELLGQAHLLRDQLDPADQARLQEHLHMLASEPVDTQIPATKAAPPVRQAAVPGPQRANSIAGGPAGSPFDADDPAQEPLRSPLDAAELNTDLNGSPLDSSLPSSSAVRAAGPRPAGEMPPQSLESAPATELPALPRNADPSLVDTTAENQRVLARQVSAEVGKRQSEAQRLLKKDPERAQAILHEAEQYVNDSKLPADYRRELLGRIAITLRKTEAYIAEHRSEIELDKANQTALDAVERDRETRAKVRQKIAEMVDQFNQLRDEQRYAEMEVVARRLVELAPDDPVVQQVAETAKFIRREVINRQLADEKETRNWEIWNDVERSSISPVGDENPLVYAKQWPEIAGKRRGSRERTRRRTERELEIERRLKTPVLLRYQDAPLSQVIDSLSALSGINIHLDPRGLSQEGVASDTPVTANLNKEISLKSALNLILEPLHLSYVVKDEVLKVTSEQLRDGEVYTYVYNVADLVIPIPNFVPNSNIGLQGLINDAHSAMGYGQNTLSTGPSVLVSDPRKRRSAPTNSDIVAQQFSPGPAAPGMPQSTVPIGAGPGGMGGGANADFDSLIDLIVSTVSTETWAENGGGEAEIRPFPTNLSLVISQTQAVHEEIADLLEQLRRLQDLQITIEVRFIRLNDRFFERIGVDFQMNIVDRGLLGATPVPGGVAIPGDGVQSGTVGLQKPVSPTNPFPNFTADLDIPFRQGSFNAAIPPIFGGFDPNSAATFGFAILSDIEAFFLIEAAQGDSRTNVLNAPKVTLFNGQQAFVADATQRPFVIGVIPVVGEFVAAQQPVIVVLNEGTMMTIQAVVSDDRRYVRLTVVPFFTQIGTVDEFTFEGASSTTSSSSRTDDDDDGKKESESESQEQSRSGVTVQLPSFSFVSVVTTVSVPDGGTVLLGGIKRLSEGRNEFGVPLLSKIPYVDRLFRNVGIGRSTESLMMMVTPRIIIQEEEEERLGIATP